MGATTVVAFGPILVRDGEIQDVDKDAYNYSEPRSCIGVVEPGHYVGLLVEVPQVPLQRRDTDAMRGDPVQHGLHRCH